MLRLLEEDNKVVEEFQAMHATARVVEYLIWCCASEDTKGMIKAVTAGPVWRNLQVYCDYSVCLGRLDTLICLCLGRMPYSFTLCLAA
jgi:hypothetical protein